MGEMGTGKFFIGAKKLFLWIVKFLLGIWSQRASRQGWTGLRWSTIGCLIRRAIVRGCSGIQPSGKIWMWLTVNLRWIDGLSTRIWRFTPGRRANNFGWLPKSPELILYQKGKGIFIISILFSLGIVYFCIIRKGRCVTSNPKPAISALGPLQNSSALPDRTLFGPKYYPPNYSPRRSPSSGAYPCFWAPPIFPCTVCYSQLLFY